MHDPEGASQTLQRTWNMMFVVFEVLRVDRCLEARLLAVNMCGGVYGPFPLYIIVDTYYIKGRIQREKMKP